MQHEFPLIGKGLCAYNGPYDKQLVSSSVLQLHISSEMSSFNQTDIKERSGMVLMISANLEWENIKAFKNHHKENTSPAQIPS